MGRNLWNFLNRSKAAQLSIATAVVLAVAGTAGAALVAQPGSSHKASQGSASGTVLPPGDSPTTPDSAADSVPGSTTSTTFPSASEPLVPETPAAPGATPILVSNGASDPVFYRLHISAPVVFVTIDDGWVRDPRVIDFVRQTGWPISIFLIERAAQEARGYFQQLQSAGATIEDHTFDHPFLTSLDAGRQTAEICRPVQDYPGMFGAVPTLLRPPYGAWNPATARAAKACGLTAVMEWSATYSNGRLAIAGGTHLRPGDAILLHFTSALYDDLVRLRQLLASQGLAVGRLESYIVRSGTTPNSTTPQTGPTTAAPTTSGPTTSSSVPATTVPATTTTQPPPKSTTSSSAP